MTKIVFISLIQLIQHPALYDQQHVRVIGFASMEFERKAIYVSEEAQRNAVTKNAIWLDIELNETNRRFHKKYVIVEGVFDQHSLGHLRLYSGTLKNINRIEQWDGETKSPD